MVNVGKLSVAALGAAVVCTTNADAVDADQQFLRQKQTYADHPKGWFQHDIRMTRSQATQYFGADTVQKSDLYDLNYFDVEEDDSSDRRDLGVMRDYGRLWDQERDSNGVAQIYWHIDRSYGTQYTRLMEDSLNLLAEEVKYIKFIRLQNPRPNGAYIHVINDAGCYSYIGRLRPQDLTQIREDYQPLSLQRGGCTQRGIIQHEFMHALGLFHEQSRSDRDSFVDIDLSTVNPQYHNNFDKLTADDSDSLKSPYDYGSVMHYGAGDFGSFGAVVINSRGNPIGQRRGASEQDVLQLQMLYKCDKIILKVDTFCQESCKCNVGEGDCKGNNNLCAGDLTCGNDGKCKSGQGPPPTKAPTSPPTAPTITSLPPTISAANSHNMVAVFSVMVSSALALFA